MLKLVAGIGVFVLLLAAIPISYIALENGCSLQHSRNDKHAESASDSYNHASPKGDQSVPTATFNLSISEPGKIDGNYYAKDTEREKENWTHKFWCDAKIGEFALVVFTLFLVVFTGGLWFSTHRLWKSGESQIEVARISAEAARTSASVAEKAIVLSDRPWISVKIVCDGPLEFKADEIGASIKITLENIGKSPAIGVSYYPKMYADIAEASVEGNIEARKFGGLFPGHLNIGRTLFPGEIATFSETLTLDRKYFIERANIVFAGMGEIKRSRPAVCVIAYYGLPAAGVTGRYRVTTELVRFKPDGDDLTGLFWTKQCEKLSLERSIGYAEEEIQRGADRSRVASDRGADVAGQSNSAGL